MEEEISSLYKVIDEANLTKAELEEQMENMRAELRSLEHNHEQVPPNCSKISQFKMRQQMMSPFRDRLKN